MTKQLTKAESKANSVIEAFRTDPGIIQAAIATNIRSGGLSEFDLPKKIKIRRAEGLQWPVSSLEGETMEAVIEGVIVLRRDTRAYYSQP